MILATAKHEAPPLFKLLAANFRKRALAFGWFSPDLDPEVAQQIPTAKRPAMLVAFVDPQSAADEQGRVPLHMEPYSLPLRYKPMAAFLESVLRRLGEGEDEVRSSACGRVYAMPFCKSSRGLLYAFTFGGDTLQVQASPRSVRQLRGSGAAAQHMAKCMLRPARPRITSELIACSRCRTVQQTVHATPAARPSAARSSRAIQTLRWRPSARTWEASAWWRCWRPAAPRTRRMLRRCRHYKACAGTLRYRAELGDG